jgi:hypothetical protein
MEYISLRRYDIPEACVFADVKDDLLHSDGDMCHYLIDKEQQSCLDTDEDFYRKKSKLPNILINIYHYQFVTFLTILKITALLMIF